MKTQPVSLMPVLRSQAQGEMLAALFASPDRSFSLTELAGLARSSVPTIMREVRRLEQAQLVSVTPRGNMQLVAVNRDHVLYEPFSKIVLYSFGPFEVLKELFGGLTGVIEAHIFGSWAALYFGAEGVDPGDIDVLLVGDFDRAAAFDLAALATERIGKSVAVSNLSEAEWNQADSAFVKTVKSRPLVNLRPVSGAT